MKFLLRLSILVSCLFAPTVFAQGFCGGVVLPEAPGIIKIPTYHRGDLMIGDWGSSGDIGTRTEMLAVYFPNYSFKYMCQLQITDQIQKDDPVKGRYMTVAMAQFELNNLNTIRHSDSLTWYGKRFYFDAATAVDETDAIAFSLKDHSASIRIEQGNPEDLVELTVRLSQPLTNAVVTDVGSQKYLRSSKGLFVEKALNITARHGRDVPRYMARLFCEKKL